MKLLINSLYECSSMRSGLLEYNQWRIQVINQVGDHSSRPQELKAERRPNLKNNFSQPCGLQHDGLKIRRVPLLGLPMIIFSVLVKVEVC